MPKEDWGNAYDGEVVEPTASDEGHGKHFLEISRLVFTIAGLAQQSQPRTGMTLSLHSRRLTPRQGEEMMQTRPQQAWNKLPVTLGTSSRIATSVGSQSVIKVGFSAPLPFRLLSISIVSGQGSETGFCGLWLLRVRNRKRRCRGLQSRIKLLLPLGS